MVVGKMNKEFDLVVKGGLLVINKEMRKADIAISGEVIALIQEDIDERLALEVIDASSKLIFPGILDVHLHPVYLDNMRDASLTAAYGGTTTLIHFAYARPGERLVDVLERFKEEGSRASLLDFGLHGGLFEADKQVKEIPKAFDLGVKSFKLFMAYAKQGWMTDDYWLMAAFDTIAKSGGLAMVHAESGLAIDYLEDKYGEEDADIITSFLRMRPDHLEAEAIFRAISMAKVADCPLYVPHVSSARGVEVVRNAKAEGQHVHAETCPQYLTLTKQALIRHGARAKIGPPLREEADRDALWQAITEGTIDVVASDHAPKEKKVEGDFFSEPFGSPQAETMLSLVYDEGVNMGRITLPRLVEILSETPAKILGLYPQKGAIQVGSDADLVIFDPFISRKITSQNQHSNAGYTLYDGRVCIGAPVLSLQRGKMILEDGEIRAKPGQGRFLPTDPGRFLGKTIDNE